MADRMASFDLIGFDLDGTLVDTSGDLAGAVNHALGTAGRGPLSVEAVQTMIGHGARTMLRRALNATGGAPQHLVDALFPTLIDHYAANLADKSRPYPGVEAVLDRLAADGVRLAVCTNKLERLARGVLEALGLAHRFAAIVGGDTTAKLKPEPDMLHAMMAAAGGGRTLFVGDSDNDVLAARAAGLPVVVVAFGYHARDPMQLGADRVIARFEELLPLVESWPPA